MFAPEDRLAIQALHEAWLQAELRHDWSALLELCTPAPVWLPPNQPPLSGKPAILQWLAGQASAAIARIDIDDLQIFGTGSYACKLARFRTTMAAPSADGAMVVSGTHGWLLHRNATGDWRVGVVEWTIAGTAKPES